MTQLPYNERGNRMKQRRMFRLALAGSLLSVIAAVLSRFNIIPLFHLQDLSSIIAFLFPIVAMVGCYLVRSRPIVGGFCLLVSALGGIIFLSVFYIIPAVFLITSGFLSILLKDETQLITDK